MTIDNINEEKAETIRVSLNKIGFDHEITVMFYTFASIINRLAFDTYFNCQLSNCSNCQLKCLVY